MFNKTKLAAALAAIVVLATTSAVAQTVPTGTNPVSAGGYVITSQPGNILQAWRLVGGNWTMINQFGVGTEPRFSQTGLLAVMAGNSKVDIYQPAFLFRKLRTLTIPGVFSINWSADRLFAVILEENNLGEMATNLYEVSPDTGATIRKMTNFSSIGAVVDVCPSAAPDDTTNWLFTGIADAISQNGTGSNTGVWNFTGDLIIGSNDSYSRPMFHSAGNWLLVSSGNGLALVSRSGEKIYVRNSAGMVMTTGCWINSTTVLAANYDGTENVIVNVSGLLR